MVGSKQLYLSNTFLPKESVSQEKVYIKIQEPDLDFKNSD